MKNKKQLSIGILLLINVIPILLLIWFAFTLYESICFPEEFVFGPDNSDKTNALIRYQWEAIAVFSVAVLLLVGMIYASVKERWKLYFSCLAFFIILVVALVKGNSFD